MKIATLRRRHPDHDAAALERYRALYEGGETWRRLIDTWLPKHDVEMPDRWAARKTAATYTNHVGAIVDFFGSHLFSEPLAVAGVEDAWLAAWQADVDQAGCSLTDWWAGLFLDAMIGRRSYCWVNLPARDEEREFTHLAEQIEAGALDAYLVPLKPEQVIWAERRGAGLRWLLTEDVLEERASVDDAVQLVWRWTYIDEHMIRRWEWRPSPDRPDQTTPRDEEEAVELTRIAHRFGRLPVVELDLTAGLWALAKLAEPAVAHLRARNDLSWALHMGANPLLVVASKGGTDSPVLGAGYYLRIGPEDRAFYVEPSGANYAILAEDVVRLREELYRVVQQLAQAADSNATRSQMSGESKGKDWQAAEIILAAYAARVKDAVRETIAIVAQLRGLKAEALQVTGLEGWHQVDLAAELEGMALAVDARALSPRFRRETAKMQAERVLGDRVKPEVLDEIRKEIDEAPVDDPAPYVDPVRRSGAPSDEDEDDEDDGES